MLIFRHFFFKFCNPRSKTESSTTRIAIKVMNTFPTFFSHDLRQFFEQWGPKKTELTYDGTKKIKLVPNTNRLIQIQFN